MCGSQVHTQTHFRKTTHTIYTFARVASGQARGGLREKENDSIKDGGTQ